MKIVHYIMLVCSGLAAGLPTLATEFPAPAGPYIKGASAILALVTGVLGLVSDSVKKAGAQ